MADKLNATETNVDCDDEDLLGLQAERYVQYKQLTESRELLSDFNDAHLKDHISVEALCHLLCGDIYRSMSATETTPLLNGSTKKTDPAPSVWTSLLQEVSLLAKTSIPASLGYMIQNSIQTVSIAVVSNYGTDEDLSASAHGFMIAMVTAWTIALGGTTAFDTLASAAFARTKSGATHSQVGILLQRNVFVLMLVYIPCAILWFFISPVLIKLGQPVDVAHMIQSFLRCLTIGAPGYILFEVSNAISHIIVLD